jgi:hypothetical protein
VAPGERAVGVGPLGQDGGMTDREVIDEVLRRIGRMHMAQERMESGAIEERGQFRGTPMNVNLNKFRPTVPQMVGALGLFVATGGNMTVEALTVVAVKATEAIRFLKPNERDVVEFILREVPHPYRDGIEETRLRASYSEATFDLDAVITSLETYKVLGREGGRLRLAV